MSETADLTAIQIPNYRLIKCVGRGAFGEVWLAEEVLTRIYRAVKIIPRDRLDKRRIELNGVRQYQQRSHGHPHLVQVLTVGETNDHFYYVMEAADNALGSRSSSGEDYEPRTLATELTRQGRMPLETALEHASAMLDGVDHLHRNGLNHRDLKPGNVLFVDGRLKLADVGLATHDDVGSAGTPGYRTPDGAPDDCYAVGVMLWEMITGEPASRFPELPADLDRTHDRRRLKATLRLIDRACHPEASRRFGAAASFAEAIRKSIGAHVGWSAFVVPAAVGMTLLVALAAWAFWPSPPQWDDLHEVGVPKGIWLNLDDSSNPAAPSRFRVDELKLHRGGQLSVTGEFELGYWNSPEDVMALMLAIDDEIVHLIEYGKAGETGRRGSLDKRLFPLGTQVLTKTGRQERCALYVVVAATDNLFFFCKEYAARGGDEVWMRARRKSVGFIERRW